MFNEILWRHYRDEIQLLEELEDENCILPFSAFCSHSVFNLVHNNPLTENNVLKDISFVELVASLSGKSTSKITSKYILSLLMDLYLEQYNGSNRRFSKAEVISENIRDYVSSKAGDDNFLSNKQTWDQIEIFETLSFVFNGNQDNVIKNYAVLKSFSEFNDICFHIDGYRQAIDKQLLKGKTISFEGDRWIDIFSALNYKFDFIKGISRGKCNFAKAVKIISEMCHRYTTVSNACMLYARDINHLSAIYTIMNCKTLTFYKALCKKLNDALKAGIVKKMETPLFRHSINEQINNAVNTYESIETFRREWCKRENYIEWKRSLKQKTLLVSGKTSICELSESKKEKGYRESIREANSAIRRVFKQLISDFAVKGRNLECGKYNDELINTINNGATADEAVSTGLSTLLRFSSEIIEKSFEELIFIDEKCWGKPLSLIEKKAARQDFYSIVSSIYTKAIEGGKKAFREKTSSVTLKRTPTLDVLDELQHLFDCSNDPSFFVVQLCFYIKSHPTYFMFGNHAQISRRSIGYMENDERTAFWYGEVPLSYDYETFEQRYLIPLKQMIDNSREMSKSNVLEDNEFDVFCNSEKIFGSTDESKIMRVACILVCIEMSNLPTREEINVMLDDIGFMPLDSKSNFDKSVMSLLTQIQDKKARERLQKNLIVEFPAENVKKCLKSTFETIYPFMAIKEEIY